MIASGDRLELGKFGPTGDKHSTGGVGDAISLVVAPLSAAVGVKVAKMSGRGLGHTGGTLDKLESIPGMRVDLDLADFVRQLRDVGVVVVGANERLVPADKRLYALRDQTATVQNPSLIASSIMSKKIAGGAQAIVLDVKVGSGAFFEDVESAREAAEIMVALGQPVGAYGPVHPQPHGRAARQRWSATRLEVAGAAEVLRGGGATTCASCRSASPARWPKPQASCPPAKASQRPSEALGLGRGAAQGRAVGRGPRWRPGGVDRRVASAGGADHPRRPRAQRRVRQPAGRTCRSARLHGGLGPGACTRPSRRPGSRASSCSPRSATRLARARPWRSCTAARPKSVSAPCR